MPGQMTRSGSLHTPALYAQTMLNARVLLFGSSVMIPSKIPANMAKTTSSPTEQTKNDTFAKRLLVSMPSVSWVFWLMQSVIDRKGCNGLTRSLGSLASLRFP